MSWNNPPKYMELPSAPPAYQDVVDESKGALPSVHSQYNATTYGSVHQYPQPTPATVSAAPAGNTFYPRQAYYHYAENTHTQPQPVILQPTVINTTVIQPSYSCVQPLLGPDPCSVFCIICQRRVMTTTSSQYPCAAHLCCFLMFMSGGLCLCSPLAYCVCQPTKVEHTCSNCDSIIGTYYNPDSL